MRRRAAIATRTRAELHRYRFGLAAAGVLAAAGLLLVTGAMLRGDGGVSNSAPALTQVPTSGLGNITSYTLVNATSSTIAQGQESGVGAFCPAGMHVLSGGYAIDGSVSGVYVIFGAPVAANPPEYATDSYGVTVSNAAGGDNVTVRAYAVCAAVHDGTDGR